jgi:hypothetical protein
LICAWAGCPDIPGIGGWACIATGACAVGAAPPPVTSYFNVAISDPFLIFACIFAGSPKGSFFKSSKIIPCADGEGFLPTNIRSGFVLLATIT